MRGGGVDDTLGLVLLGLKLLGLKLLGLKLLVLELRATKGVAGGSLRDDRLHCSWCHLCNDVTHRTVSKYFTYIVYAVVAYLIKQRSVQ